MERAALSVPVEALRVNAFGFLALVALFVLVRYWMALREREAEVALPEALPPSGPARSQEVL